MHTAANRQSQRYLNAHVCLQAFRHLYVLAAESRCLQAVDVHSRQQVVVPLDITAHKHGMVGPVLTAAAAAAAHAKAAHAGQQQQQHGVQGLMAAQQQQQQGCSKGGAQPMVWSPTAGRRGTARQLLLQPQQQQQHQQERSGSGAAAQITGSTTGAAAAGLDLVQFRRHAPCLLPERQHLVSMRVCGPRYWPIQVAAAAGSSSGGGWSHLYLQQRICVKKKAGSLPYVDDPSGVKSLLFKAFYSGGSSSIGSSSSNADADLEEAGFTGGEQQHQQQGAFDIVHLCNTFSADPNIQAFAQLLRAATAAGQHANSSSSSSSSSKQLQQCAGGLGGSVAASGSAAGVVPGSSAAAAAAFLAFCHGALYECIVQEKTSVLPWYLQLYSLGHRVCSAAAAAGSRSSSGGQLPQLSLLGGAGANWGCSTLSPGVQLQDLRLVLGYYNSSIAAAAGLCRAAVVRSCSSSRGVSSAGQQQQQQQQDSWQVEALGWLPLLQPGFCDGLWQALQQQWRRAGLLPAVHGLSGSSSSSSEGGCSAIEAYIATGSISAAAAAAVAAGSASAPAAAAGCAEVLEQLLGSCLAMLSMPSAAELQRACNAALQKQGKAEGAGPAADASVWMPALAELLGPGASGLALAVSSCCCSSPARQNVAWLPESVDI
jgi:anaphase-promoting complex subunit 1